MPIPLLVWPLGMLAAWGVKKCFDASSTNDEAQATNERAARIAEKAREEVVAARDETQAALEELGGVKLEAWRDSMGRFVELFGRLRHVELDDRDAGAVGSLAVDLPQLAELRELSGYAEEALSGGVAGLGAGALVGVASYGGAVMFASASTGTALATLSGAAATNATLAFFGGGALAAGGAGIAGGMMVLGGLVAGPVLLVFGWVLASKADENLAEARKNLSKATEAASEHEVATTAMQGVTRLAKSFTQAIRRVDAAFGEALDVLEATIEKAGRDYGRYSKKQREVVFLAVQFAQAMKTLLETPLLEKDGTPRVNEAQQALNGVKALTASDS